ncbi:hypothetical protein [Arenimonas caeni]|uniref:Uncharacterized protein n=1 Tax=Arenimonas caeni TaxID=2058085 RepID=A0A2P6M5F1_9GAMM|nr:hypothetical protein [Arenimonas caeni]PRH81243.1 hypothetical protein C6N40_13635 [Arenimonas caeni]
MDESIEVQRNDIDDLVTISVEAWKFVRLFQRAVAKLDPSEQAKFVSQARYMQKKVDSLMGARGIRLESLEGMRFEPGLAATPLNLDEFESPHESLVVLQMIEPVVMGPEGVMRTGTYVLGAL